MATNVTLESISRQIDKGFAAVAEDIAEIKSIMATKDDITSIRMELADIRRDLDDLREKYGNIVGYRKEIDHALERVRVIEKHLDIRR